MPVTPCLLAAKPALAWVGRRRPAGASGELPSLGVRPPLSARSGVPTDSAVRETSGMVPLICAQRARPPAWTGSRALCERWRRSHSPLSLHDRAPRPGAPAAASSRGSTARLWRPGSRRQAASSSDSRRRAAVAGALSSSRAVSPSTLADERHRILPAPPAALGVGEQTQSG